MRSLSHAGRQLVLRARPGVTEGERRRFDRDLTASGLIQRLEAHMAWFAEHHRGAELARGRTASLGSSLRMARSYYYLVRKYRPAVVVETGVCNGLSTALVLQALEDNGAGSLHSIDYPEVIGRSTAGEHWSGKGGAAVPPDRQPGWMVPDALRQRWTLVLGKSTDRLRPLLEELEQIDCFVHDSEHSYENMMFEFSVAWRHVRRGGVLASNDIRWNRSFFDFSALHGRLPRFLTWNDAFIVK